MVSRAGYYLSVISFLCLSLSCRGTEYQPWIGNYYEFEWRNDLLYQSYNKINSKHFGSNDLFLHASLSNAIGENYSVELETTAARTHRQDWNIDNLRLAGRYVWLDDIAGDPLTVTGGLVLTQAFIPSLEDVSSFHHGRREAELFVSFGKENSEKELWENRWWGVVGIGFADKGSPWIRADVDYEFQYCEADEIRVFLNSLWGLGNKSIHVHDFKGYGPIAHQSIDIGLRYTRELEYCGHFFVEYAFRPYAKNFPTHTNRVLLGFLVTFIP